MKQRCRKCGRIYPSTSTFFYRSSRSKSGLQTICKKCHNKETMEWVAKNRKRYNKMYTEKRHKQQILLDNLKCELGCALCGYNEYPESLDFHHVNPKDKNFNINIKTLYKKDYIDELIKCMCLCKNCHAHITRIENNVQE